MKTLVERAFELAESRLCADTDDIVRQMKAEGYVGLEEHLTFALTRQLRRICRGVPAPARPVRKRRP